MPLLRTDDAPRRLRAVWLGAGSHRFPVDWTFVTWATGAALTLVMCPLWFLVGWLLGGPGMGFPFAFLIGPACALGITRIVERVVDYYRPVRYWRADIRAQLKAGRADPDRTTTIRLRSRCKRVVLSRPALALLPIPPKLEDDL